MRRNSKRKDRRLLKLKRREWPKWIFQIATKLFIGQLIKWLCDTPPLHSELIDLLEKLKDKYL